MAERLHDPNWKSVYLGFEVGDKVEIKPGILVPDWATHGEVASLPGTNSDYYAHPQVFWEDGIKRYVSASWLQKRNQTLNVLVAIGNSDDKLTQERWAKYAFEFEVTVRSHASHPVHGCWYSATIDPYQNMSMAFTITANKAQELKNVLSLLAAKYDQQSIAWLQGETEFIWAAQESDSESEK